MSSNHTRLEELLRRFRTSNGYIDVAWQTARTNVLKSKLTEGLANMTQPEFEKLVLSNWFYLPRRKERQYEEIIRLNGFESVKLRLLDLLVGKGPIRDRIQAFMNLEGVGPFIASQFLSTVDDQYIMYHDDLVEGVRTLFDELFGEEFQYHFADVIRKPADAESYLELNEICKAIKDNFGFKSLGEVHEFFVHFQQRLFQVYFRDCMHAAISNLTNRIMS